MDWRDLLAVAGASAQRPPASLRDRVLRASTPLPFTFIRQREGIWLHSDDARVATKALFLDSGDRWSTRLVRLHDGASPPPPTLGGRRTWLVIAGALQRGAARLGPGDLVSDGSDPAEWSARGETLVLEQCEATTGDDATWRQSTAQWHPVAPGIRVAAAMGAGRVMMVDAEAHAVLPEHQHAGIEELFVLRGSCEVMGQALEAGDYHRALPESTHEATVSGANGCVLFTSLRIAETAG